MDEVVALALATPELQAKSWRSAGRKPHFNKWTLILLLLFYLVQNYSTQYKSKHWSNDALDTGWLAVHCDNMECLATD